MVRCFGSGVTGCLMEMGENKQDAQCLLPSFELESRLHTQKAQTEAYLLHLGSIYLQ